MSDDALRGAGWRAWAPPIFLFVLAAGSFGVGLHVHPEIRASAVYLFIVCGASFGAAVMMIVWNRMERTWTTSQAPPTVHHHSISISRTGARIAVAITFIPAPVEEPPST
jgi:hypothetical protein